MGSSEMAHSRVAPGLKDLYGGLIVFMKIHLDVDLLNPLVVLIGNDVCDCPTDDVAAKALLAFARPSCAEDTLGHSFPQL